MSITQNFNKIVTLASSKESSPQHFFPSRMSITQNFNNITTLASSKESSPQHFFPSRMSITQNFNNITTLASSKESSPQTVCSSPLEFHPSVWGDQFIAISPFDLKRSLQIEERIEELKKELKALLNASSSDTLWKLKLIDDIQHLGVAYHFESEIENNLQKIYDDCNDESYNLHVVALRFRLLRQAGFDVSPDIFEKFKDDKDGFEEKLSLDVNSMLSLYEAANVSYREEVILEEAITFTTHHLKKLMVNHLTPTLVEQVQHALELPRHKRFVRLEARHYMSVYQEDELRNESLLEFAKLDFNFVQALHQRELAEVSRWWRDMDIIPKLPFSMRDRLVEGYTVMANMMSDPRHSTGRIYMSKLFAILTVLDDSFDVYRKLDELEPLTNAILRWDVGEPGELPEYMRITVLELKKLFNEVEEEMTKRGQPYSILYFQLTMQEYVRNLLIETKLFQTGQVPSLKEWLQGSIITSTCPLLIMGCILDTWEHATREALEWASKEPKIVTAVSMLARIMDDIQTCKLEQARGIMPSSVTCYMKDYGVSEEEAIKSLRKMINEKWKDINKECLRPTPVSMHLLMFPVNLARMGVAFYQYGDGYTNSDGYTKQMIASLLLHPIPI